MPEEQPEQIHKLTTKLEKTKGAIDNMFGLNETIGTPEGPARLDLTQPDLTPQDSETRQRLGREARLRLATHTLEKLSAQEFMLKDYLQRATNAENDYRQAEESYLLSQGNYEDDKKFDEAHTQVEALRAEIDALFTRPKKSTIVSENQNQETSQNISEEPTEDIPEEDTSIPLITQALITHPQESAVTVTPSRIHLSKDFFDHVGKLQKGMLITTSPKDQMEELGILVTEARNGTLQVPTPMDFLQAADRLDRDELTKQSTAAIRALIAKTIILPDGSVDLSKGIIQKTGRAFSDLLTMAGVSQVVQSLNALTPVEQTILYGSLSISTKEKLGSPDIEFCPPEDMAGYFKHSFFDALAPERREKRWLEADDYFGQKEVLLSKELFHLRDTTMPVEAVEIFEVIMERDAREPNFAQSVIEVMLSDESSPGRRVKNPEDHTRMTHYLFKRLIGICYDADLLSHLMDFFNSHPDTEKYAKQVDRMLFEND